MKISGLQKLTLLDFPGHTACTVFTNGCNFRCPFCHNASLVVRAAEQPYMEDEKFFEFLKKRHGLLDGVCVTGGEPTLQKDLPEFLRNVHDMGFLTKLDTNGYRPEILKRILDEKLADYVAMDIKTSRERYPIVTGVPELDVSKVEESAAMLMAGDTPFEFRTTVVDELHEAEDFQHIGEWIKGAPQYFVQSFKDSGDVIKSGFSSPKKEKLEKIADIMREFVPTVQIRGVD